MRECDEYNGFGTEPAAGEPISGPTILPTWWKDQVPVAIPVDGWEAEKCDHQYSEQTVAPLGVRCIKCGNFVGAWE